MQKIDSIEQVFHFQNKPKEVFSTASDGHAWHHGKTLWEFGGATRRQIPALFPVGAVGATGRLIRAALESGRVIQELCRKMDRLTRCQVCAGQNQYGADHCIGTGLFMQQHSGNHTGQQGPEVQIAANDGRRQTT